MLGIKKAAEELNLHSETLGQWMRLETNPLTCQMCGFKAAKQSKLERHQKMHRAAGIPQKAQVSSTNEDQRESKGTLGGNATNKYKESLDSAFDKEGPKEELGDNKKECIDSTHIGDYFEPNDRVSTDTAVRIEHHKKSKHNEGTLVQCTHCEKEFATTTRKQRAALKQHLKRHFENEFICNYCGMTMTRKESLQDHVKSKHKEGTKVQCTHCEKVFPTTRARKQHLKKAALTFTCDHCGVTLSTKDTLQDHLKSKHDEGTKVRCTHCEKMFATTRARKYHIESKHEGKRYPCPYCTQTATQKINLKTHIKKKHKMDNTVF